MRTEPQPEQPDATDSQPHSAQERVAVGSGDLLDALFEQYVTADTEARGICDRMMAENRAFKDAEGRRDEAWEKYRTAKNESASNIK